VTDGGGANLPNANTWAGGLYYRSPVPIVVVVKQTRDYTAWQPIDAVVLAIPQAGPVSFIPMEANARGRVDRELELGTAERTAFAGEGAAAGRRWRLRVRVQGRPGAHHLGTQSLSLAD
jgi:hypothetical protein